MQTEAKWHARAEVFGGGFELASERDFVGHYKYNGYGFTAVAYDAKGNERREFGTDAAKIRAWIESFALAGGLKVDSSLPR